MKRKFLIVALTFVCALCLALGISACSLFGGTDSTLVMEEGVVYFTDFSIKYTSAEDSPNGDIDESTLSDEIDGSVQNYYLVMNFDMQLASNTDGLEYITVKFVVLDADVVETIIDYADTSNVSVITSDGQTTITATYSLPDKAKKVKNINYVLELKPKTTGATDILYSFSSDTKAISGYTDNDITYKYTNNSISTSKTSLEYTLNEDGQSYSVTGIGTKNYSIIYIKSKYNDFPVTSIGDSAFSGCTSLTRIEIPDSIASIGDSAFYGCTSLESITIPDSVTSISDFAFYGCTSFESITIPDSVTTIGEGVFCECSSLKSITIPDSINSIGDSAFKNCSSLESINIPDSIISIGDSVFYGCTSLKSITIPDSITSIGDSAFEGCTSLTYYEYENGYYLGNDNNNYVVLIKAIDTSIEFFNIHSKVKAIYYKALEFCSALSITIPDCVTYIGSYAFYCCTSLTSISIPDSVTSIGNYAFDGCTSLTYYEYKNGYYLGNENNNFVVLIDVIDTTMNSFTIHSKAKVIYRSAFYNYKSLESITIPDSVTSIGEYAFYWCTSLESITIPDSVTSIGNNAFSECAALKSITIPDSVTSIGSSPFYGCTALNSINVDSGNTAYKSIDGNLYSYDGTILIRYAIGKTDTSFTIPNSVTLIGNNAFNECIALKSITIPDSVTSIGRAAFSGCTSLKSITIPDRATSIGDSAFFKCTSLTSISIPDSVTSIGGGAFYKCTSLTSITIPDSVTSIGGKAFYGCTALKSVTFENTSGWYYTETVGATSGTTILSSLLSSSLTAATYLKSNYSGYYWYRK